MSIFTQKFSIFVEKVDNSGKFDDFFKKVSRLLQENLTAFTEKYDDLCRKV